MWTRLRTYYDSATGRRIRTGVTYAGAQTLAYSILVVNMRSVAHGKLALALLSDAVYAAIAFTILRKIAKDESSREAMIGYVIGSLIGTTIGMHV